MKLSIVVPVYNEEQNLPSLFTELDQTLPALKGFEVELVFVDDGSQDGSLVVLKQQADHDPRVRVISFSRNFGSHAALMAGFRHSTGDVVTCLSADMQDSPELLPRLLEKWREGYRVVWGVRETREESFVGAIYWLLMRRLALKDMPKGGVDFCLVDRQVLDTVINMQEKNTSVVGLIMWTGFPQTFVSYRRRPRKHGVSGWTLGKKLKMFLDSFVSFSFFPIRLVSYLGLGISTLGFLYAGMVIARRFLFDTPLLGWPSLMVAVVTLSGVQLLMLGIVAEYLWRTFDESRGRPPFVIHERIGFPAADVRHLEKQSTRPATPAAEFSPRQGMIPNEPTSPEAADSPDVG